MSLWWNDKEIREATSVLHTKTELSKFKKPQLIQMLVDRQNEVKDRFRQECRTWDTPVSEFQYELVKELGEWKEFVKRQDELIRELKK